MPTDHFQPTLSTTFWRENDPEVVNRHLMSTYWEPLRIYYLSMRDWRAADADDVLNGFFANRLHADRLDLVEKWLTHREDSGIRLRRWLITALKYYVKEHDRPCAMDPRRGVGHVDDDHPAPDEDELERATMLAFVRQALVDAERVCVAAGKERNWFIFRAHYLDGRGYREIEDELGLEPGKAWPLARTAIRYFKVAFETIMKRDGAGDAEINREIARYIKEDDDARRTR